MSAKKKKQSNNPLRIIIILALLGLMAYKYQLFDGKLLENPPKPTETEQPSPGISPTAGNNGSLEIPVMQSSADGQILKRKGYTLSYNADYKTPQWVAWELTKKETTGTEGRTDKFLPDPDVRGAKAYTGDYTKSGYDRGHMAPAADMKWSRQAMEESFYLSNICPQNPNLNRGDWNDLEEQSRKWAKKYGVVYITCGPIYDTKRPKRIGNNKVAVPDAFYKVVLINDKKNPQAIGFIFPNKAGHKPLKKYMVTVDSVEKRTNIDFFPALPDEIEDRIEAELVQELP
ncbi:DNA/RNA non-specific endonuclease [Phocaeicola sp.]